VDAKPPALSSLYSGTVQEHPELSKRCNNSARLRPMPAF